MRRLTPWLIRRSQTGVAAGSPGLHPPPPKAPPPQSYSTKAAALHAAAVSAPSFTSTSPSASRSKSVFHCTSVSLPRSLTRTCPGVAGSSRPENGRVPMKSNAWFPGNRRLASMALRLIRSTPSSKSWTWSRRDDQMRAWPCSAFRLNLGPTSVRRRSIPGSGAPALSGAV